MQFRVQDDAELPDLPFRIFAGMRVSGDVSSKLRKDEKISFQALFSGVQYVSCLSIKTQRIWHLDELVAKKKKEVGSIYNAEPYNRLLYKVWFGLPIDVQVLYSR